MQLTCPGVADTYQGTELPDLSLVDPDNRRPVDYDLRRAGLADLADGAAPSCGSPRRRCGCAASTRSGSSPRRRTRRWTPGSRALAFVRSDQVVVVAPTRALRVERDGWGEDALTLPDGHLDRPAGRRRHATGTVRLAEAARRPGPPCSVRA